MKISNFTKEELSSYYNKKEVHFFNYRRVYTLVLKNDKFSFIEDESRRIYSGLGHTLRGRYMAFKENSSYYISTSKNAPKKIELAENILSKIKGGNLKAKILVTFLKGFGFTSTKALNDTSLKNLSFKGSYINSVTIDTENKLILLTY